MKLKSLFLNIRRSFEILVNIIIRMIFGKIIYIYCFCSSCSIYCGFGNIKILLFTLFTRRDVILNLKVVLQRALKLTSLWDHVNFSLAYICWTSQKTFKIMNVCLSATSRCLSVWSYFTFFGSFVKLFVCAFTGWLFLISAG